jgi:hypothetical protein
MIDAIRAKPRDDTAPAADQNVPRAKRSPLAEFSMRATMGSNTLGVTLRAEARLMYEKIRTAFLL